MSPNAKHEIEKMIDTTTNPDLSKPTPNAVEQWAELPAFDDGTAAFVEHFGLTAPRLKTDFGKNGSGFVDEQTGEKRDQLNLVMLAFPPSRAWWLVPLNEGGSPGDPPSCYSTAGALTVPDPDVPDRQSATCTSCEHAKWIDGAKPACEEAVNLFVFDQDTEGYYWMRFHRTALKPFRAYVSSLLSKKKPLFSVVTKVTTAAGDKKKGFDYLVPVFAEGDALKPADVAPMREVAQSAMKQWTAVAEEMAAAERGGDGATTEDSPAVEVVDSSGEVF